MGKDDFNTIRSKNMNSFFCFHDACKIWVKKVSHLLPVCYQIHFSSFPCLSSSHRVCYFKLSWQLVSSRFNSWEELVEDWGTGVQVRLLPLFLLCLCLHLHLIFILPPAPHPSLLLMTSPAVDTFLPWFWDHDSSSFWIVPPIVSLSSTR